MKRFAIALLFLAAIVPACSKKQEVTPAATPETAPAAATTPDANAGDTAATQPPPGPVLDTTQMSGDAKQAIADADAALRQKEYEKAVRTMLAIQQAQLNAQQAEAAHQQMVNLQRNLANAIANGDPNAIAAAQILRAAHSH
jgi:hypothetical protein